MWIYMTNVKLAEQSPNHLREKIFVQAKTTLHGYVNRDRKCQNKEGQKKLHSFFDSKKKMKVPKENASKRTESNKTKALKRKETNENVSTSKENKDNIINNKETKDKAFDGKTDDKVSKSEENIKRHFSESDTDESDCPKKKKTNSNKFKGAFLSIARFSSEWCKEWPFIQPCNFFCCKIHLTGYPKWNE